MATAIQNKTFRTSVNLSEQDRSRLIDLLNNRLATATDLKTQVKHAHWNVKGKDFYQLHELFDEIATRVEAHIDLIAERATALGGVAQGTLRLAAGNTELKEYDLDAVTGEEHVRALVRAVGHYANHIRQAIDIADQAGDQGTADLFTEIVREADKDLWFLEAHLQA